MHKTMDDTLNRRVGIRRATEPASSTVRPPEYAGLNTFGSDPVLTATLDSALDEATEEHLRTLGGYWGSAEAQEVARIAAAAPPQLRRTDFDGYRVDQVEVHPAYHAMMNRSIATGLTSSAWEDGDDRRQHRLRAAALFLTAQCDRGHLTVISSTHASVAALAYASDLEAQLFPLIATRRYDRKPLPLGEKDGATVTLALTERDGSADRSAVAMHGEIVAGDRLSVTGEKWFVCAPTADLALVLARTAEGPTAAMIPRYAAENEDAIDIEALRDVGGLASQAVASVSFHGATGQILGEPGRGLHVLRDVRTLLQLDGAIIAAGAIRAAVGRAVHHARYRETSGKLLVSHPLHARVLADLALESAAHTALCMRVAAAFDQAFERDGDHALARLVTPAARLYTVGAAPALSLACNEAIGGTAFDALHPSARIHADVTALSAWDGTANEAALDLVMQVERDRQVLRDALGELGADLGNTNADIIEDTLDLGERAVADIALARAFAEQLAMVAAASAMRRNLPRVIADAYIATRLRERFRAGYGTLDGRFDAAAILDFVAPED
ncbi:DNA alkylation response protein [Acuticoccus sediminis]|uniref:DNA alkylation response protein n=1 Tax=Acuticoccus sediminis TaxID=2184697 RepID=A0A8B2P360_9HYPH|nr:acyl-CoA dehydrogenase family protein [Acuticoccus sediminis]RAI04384.1 DNA alkylation response protein [Acuticoccus sediminis]